MSEGDRIQINVGDVLRLVLPLDTQVIAGGQQTRRPINWITVMTHWRRIRAHIQPNDIVLMSLEAQREMPDEEMVACVDKLKKLDAAALVAFQDVSHMVKEAANRSDIPLLIVPTKTTLREVHQGIASLLIDRRVQITDRGMQLYRHLSEISREGKGLQAMADVIMKLTGKVVVIQDKRLEFQALSEPHTNPLPMSEVTVWLQERDSLPKVLQNRKAAAKARQNHWQQQLPTSIGDVTRLVTPIISGDRARGYLSIIGLTPEIDLLDAISVEQGAAACALEMAKAKAISEAKKALRGNFLEGLLAGTLPAGEIERLSTRLDHNTTKPHAILVYAWDGTAPPSLRRLETTLNWLSSEDQPLLVHIYGGTHICVFQTLRKDDLELSACFELDRRLREQMKAEMPNLTARLIGGMSAPMEDLAEWPPAHQRALQAMQLGKKLRLDRLVEYNSLGIYRLLAQLETQPTVMQFCQQIIGPLVEYDRSHNSNLVQTIEAYFEHHGNISQTAESLFIHRNTLLYRLERIQELTGQSLEQSDMRLALHLSLKLWLLRGRTET